MNIPGFNINNLGSTTTSQASASRPAQQFVQASSAPGGFAGLFPKSSNALTPSAPTAAPTQPSTSSSSGSGGGGGNSHVNPSTGNWDDNYFASQQQASPDYGAQIRNDINSGYDSYFSSLDDILNNGLPQQQTAQTNIANSQYDQGVSSLGTQKTLGQQDLQGQRDKANTQQNKTLQDLSGNIRNLFQSGNVYLGARGAADSSASDQYAYALTKLGSQQRGDVTRQYADIQNDINGRESRLNEVYNGQVKDLGFQKDQQINSIAQWFGEQQNALKQAKAQGQLSRGQDLASLSQNLLNVALQQLQNVQAQSQAHQQALDEWAANHSNDINSLKSNLSAVSNTNYSMPSYTPINGSPSVAGNKGASLFGFGNTNDQRTNLFGQPIA